MATLLSGQSRALVAQSCGIALRPEGGGVFQRRLLEVLDNGGVSQCARKGEFLSVAAPQHALGAESLSSELPACLPKVLFAGLLNSCVHESIA